MWQAADYRRVCAGDCLVSDDAGAVFATVLGSCVAACVRDTALGIGGMNHFVLPARPATIAAGDDSPLMYGDTAMPALVDALLRAGCRQRFLEVKLFGGACARGRSVEIGPRNADCAEEFVARHGLVLAAAHLRRAQALRVHYHAATGKAMIRGLPLEQHHPERTRFG